MKLRVRGGSLAAFVAVAVEQKSTQAVSPANAHHTTCKLSLAGLASEVGIDQFNRPEFRFIDPVRTED